MLSRIKKYGNEHFEEIFPQTNYEYLCRTIVICLNRFNFSKSGTFTSLNLDLITLIYDVLI